MSDDAKWIVGLGVPILLLLAGALWKLVDRRIESIWDQIGRSSEEGMRKTVHSTANRTSENGLRLSDHDRRLEHVERKVFNGHRQENER